MRTPHCLSQVEDSEAKPDCEAGGCSTLLCFPLLPREGDGVCVQRNVKQRKSDKEENFTGRKKKAGRVRRGTEELGGMEICENRRY